MNKIFNAIKRSPKRVIAAVTAVLLAIIIPVATQAWGPNRQTFTMAQPATFNTFNSIVDNPHIGDERNFVGIRERGTTNLWSSDLRVERGKEYVVRFYVHNGAADGLGLVAEGVRASINVPGGVGRQTAISGFLDSTNATPNRIWDQARVYADEDFSMMFVPGSARWSNNTWPNGIAIPDSVVTQQGALLGFNALDGRIPGCLRYAGYLTIIVRPQFAEQHTLDMTVDKTVRRLGQTGTGSWVKTTTANPGETVEFQIRFQNLSTTTVEDVHIRDVLPAGLTFIPGTVRLFNSNHPNGVAVSDGLVTTGINIGSYAVNGVAYVRFQARVVTAANLACGPNQLINRGHAGFPKNDFGMRESTATVNVYRECEEEPPTPPQPPVPPELPVTGSAGVIGSIIALGSLATSGAYYWISRKRA